MQGFAVNSQKQKQETQKAKRTCFQASRRMGVYGARPVLTLQDETNQQTLAI